MVKTNKKDIERLELKAQVIQLQSDLRVKEKAIELLKKERDGLKVAVNTETLYEVKLREEQAKTFQSIINTLLDRLQDRYEY